MAPSAGGPSPRTLGSRFASHPTPARTDIKMQLRSASRGLPTLAAGVPRPFRPRIEAAERNERALRASGTDRSAEVFPESDEQLVDVEPVLLRHRTHESPLRRLGSLRPHEAETIADPMDVGVGRNARHAESVHEDAVGGLRADLGEFDQLLIGPRHRAGMA